MDGLTPLGDSSAGNDNLQSPGANRGSSSDYDKWASLPADQNSNSHVDIFLRITKSTSTHNLSNTFSASRRLKRFLSDREKQGFKKLAKALLIVSLYDVKMFGRDAAITLQDYENAVKWLENELENPLPFTTACEMLGLSPSNILDRLDTLTDGELTELWNDAL